MKRSTAATPPAVAFIVEPTYQSIVIHAYRRGAEEGSLRRTLASVVLGN